MTQIIDLETKKLINVDSQIPELKKTETTATKRSNIIDLGNLPSKSKSNQTEYMDSVRQSASDALNYRPDPIDEDFTIGETFWNNVGRGAVDIARGLYLADDESPSTRRRMEAMEKQNPITATVGRISGQAAPFMIPGTAVAAAPTWPSRITAAGSLGAIEGNVIAEGLGGTESEVNTATGIGAGIGVGAEILFPVLGRLGNKLINAAFKRQPTTPIVNKLGQPSKELEDALDSLDMTFDDLVQNAEKQVNSLPIDAKQKAKEALLNEAGINNPTKAQLTGDATDFQVQQELAKKSGPVRAALESQDAALMGRFTGSVENVGATSKSQPYNPVINYIEDKSLALDSAISNAYKSARELTSNEKAVRPDNLIKALRSMAGDETASGGVYSAVKGFLKEKGLQVGKGKGRIDVNTAESLRQSINSLYDSVTPYGKGKLRELKSAIDEDVFNFAGEDAFKEARKMKTEFEKSLTRTKNNKFDRRNKEFLRDILENKYSPDTFFNDAIIAKSTRSSDLNQIKQYFLEDGSPGAVEAWNSVRADSLEWIRDNAFNEVGGKFIMTRAKLDKALDRIGKDKLQVLFSPEERQFFDLMKRVSRIREPASGTQQGLGPSAQGIAKLYQKMTDNSAFYDVFKSLQVSKTEKGALTLNPTIMPLTEDLRNAAVAGAVSIYAPPEQTEEQPN